MQLPEGLHNSQEIFFVKIAGDVGGRESAVGNRET
jgi:hypothetical protein